MLQKQTVIERNTGTALHFLSVSECVHVAERLVWSVECRGFESHPRQLILLRKSDCLGCAVLLCLVLPCLYMFDLACFILPSLISH